MDSSDFDSLSESSGSEDQDIEFLYGGRAFSILSSLEEAINKIDDFLSFERAFSHGDVVCLVTDPSGQLGRVVDVDKMVDLENINGRKILGVNSKNLQKIRSISVGDYVVRGAWLGKVEKVVDSVTILFDNGTQAELSANGPEKIIPISSDLLEDSQYPFYPGQRVQVEPSYGPQSTGWLCGMRKDKREKGTVCAIDAGLVYVDWLGCAMSGCDKMTAPSSLQNSKGLTLLSCFSYANWQVGDWCLLPISDYESIGERMLHPPTDCRLNKDNQLPEKLIQSRANVQDMAFILKAKTKVDVIWQDGSWSSGLSSESLFSVNVVDAHDYWPDQFVMEKGTSDDILDSGARRWGVVRSVDARERTAKVRWSSGATSDLREGEHIEEVVSAYELEEHPDYSYCLGDAIFKFESTGLMELAAGGQKYEITKISQISIGDEKYPKHTETGGNKSQYPSNSYLSSIGIVVGFKDGNIEVKWASGARSMVAPYEIYKIDNWEDVPSTAPDVAHVKQESEQMTVPDNHTDQVRPKDMMDLCGGNDDCEKSYWVKSSYSLQQTAMEIFSSITSRLFPSVGASLIGRYKHISQDEETAGTFSIEGSLEHSHLGSGGSPLVIDDSQTVQGTNAEQWFKNALLEKGLTASLNKHPGNFRNFDMVSGCLDHHFLGSGKDLHTQVKNGWLKKVQQEWSILEKDLPETIYVRVYEERMDLLRAAIMGAPGTPYHDGLFFFDMYLPPGYPNEPPMAYYYSGGLRLNPNLYESGKICLSLLNTWTGSGTEVWNPGSSNILQVLLSLQALVLNEKPYYNEAGYDSQIGKAEGEKNSISYNENAFLMSCKSMLYILRKPPQHFEALVEKHFSRHSEHILLACKAYMEGAPVGSAFRWPEVEQERQSRSSAGFKIMLTKLFPKLVEAFSDKGIDCSHMSGPEGE